MDISPLVGIAATLLLILAALLIMGAMDDHKLRKRQREEWDHIWQHYGHLLEDSRKGEREGQGQGQGQGQRK